MQRERAGNADPLALAAAELMRKTLCGGGVEPDEAEQCSRLVARFGGRDAVDDGAFRDNVDDALARIERSVGILKHHLHAFADRAELAARELRDIRAVKQNSAAVNRHEPGDGARQGALARAAFPDEAECLTAAQFYRHARQRTRDTPTKQASRAKGLGNIARLDDERLRIRR